MKRQVEGVRPRAPRGFAVHVADVHVPARKESIRRASGQPISAAVLPFPCRPRTARWPDDPVPRAYVRQRELESPKPGTFKGITGRRLRRPRRRRETSVGQLAFAQPWTPFSAHVQLLRAPARRPASLRHPWPRGSALSRAGAAQIGGERPSAPPPSLAATSTRARHGRSVYEPQQHLRAAERAVQAPQLSRAPPRGEGASFRAPPSGLPGDGVTAATASPSSGR